MVTRARSLCLAALLSIATAVLPLPSRSFGHAAPHVAASSSVSFDTTISGITSDKHHVVSVEVQRNDANHTVVLTITVHGSKTQKGASSSYQFSLPAGDLTVTRNLHPRTAHLDTHQHLGQYGHITASWTYGTKGATLQTFNASGCTAIGAASTTTITRFIASGSAMLDLTFPCEGAIRAQLKGTNLNIDSGQALALALNGDGIQGLGANLYFTTTAALRRTGTKQIVVGGFKISNGPASIFVSTSTDTHAATGLVNTTHIASDAMPAGGLSNPTSSSAKLVYNGVLGSANLTFSRAGQSVSVNRAAGCVNPQASDKATLVSVQTAGGDVAGSASLAACGTVAVTFHAGDVGIVAVTGAPSASTSVTPVVTAPTPVPGNGGAIVSIGGLGITSISPTNGATGVSTSPIIHAIFTGTLEPNKITVLLIEAGNPAGIVMLPPPTLDAASNSISTTPAIALKPNTSYKLLVSALNSSGGMTSSNSTFTTGS
ncbi:MAG: hypothetical protein JWO59_2352 [Chloroflexi bacterium]|nr:hypothetical protein [Chloroflexota bacterium]MDB5076224.1 hypothetical protein [Chloroflexota bacterium]